MIIVRVATLSLGAALLLAACKDTSSAGTDVPAVTKPEPAQDSGDGSGGGASTPPNPEQGEGGAPKPTDSTFVECTPDSRKGGMCTREYRPVCGQKADSTLQTYPNPCNACSDTAVQRYRFGACDSAGTPQ